MEANTENNIEYKNDTHGIILTNKLLTVGSQTYPLNKLSGVEKVSKKSIPAWPGWTFLIWGGLVVWSDTLPPKPGVAPNNPLFKYVLVFIGIAYFIFLAKTSTKYQVNITIGLEKTIIAEVSDEKESDEIIANIKSMLSI